jgi:HD-like signal output (HDOD) protein
VKTSQKTDRVAYSHSFYIIGVVQTIGIFCLKQYTSDKKDLGVDLHHQAKDWTISHDIVSRGVVNHILVVEDHIIPA